MKKLSFDEIRAATARGDFLPLLRWGQYNSPDKDFQELCKVYRKLYINEQRTYRRLGVMPYNERPQWHRDLIEKVSLRDTDLDEVILMALNDMSSVETAVYRLNKKL